MTGYLNLHSFYTALPGLIEGGATLEDLYREMLTVEDRTEMYASPAGLRQLATVSMRYPRFVPIRLSELFGGLSVERSDDYVLAMVGGLSGWRMDAVLEYVLRNDHSLREHIVWRIFEVEGGGQVSLSVIDRCRRGDGNWHDMVVTLTAEGALDRARVLRSCLEALNRDFSSYRAGWFSRTYAALAPTPEESALDQGLLLVTLSSSVTASVSLAVTTLAAVHQAGLLDADAFVESCRPALTGAKGAATTVLRVLSALAADVATDPGAVAETIALAMANAHPDVQRAAVTALVKVGREDLAWHGRDLLAPAVAAEMLPRLVAPVAPADAVAISALAPPGAAPARPWSDDDAFERYAFLLEDPSDAMELELALAWLATAPTPGAVLAPLVKRVRKPPDRGMTYEPVSELLLAAVSADHRFMEQEYGPEDGAPPTDGEGVEPQTHRPWGVAEGESRIPSFITRLREVVAIVQGQEPSRLLLATPTDSHGWVDSGVFVDRFRAGERAGIAPLAADLSQAVLRLAPGERAGVLATFGLDEPQITESMRIEWSTSETPEKKPNGDPLYVWWHPAIVAHPGTSRWLEHPALIPSDPDPVSTYIFYPASALEIAETAFVYPPSTVPLIAAGISTLVSATLDATPVREEAVLDALSWHPGVWMPETVQLVALGMAAKRPEVRARAVELLAAAVPHRITAQDAAAGFAACAPACVLTRWSGSFSDAATLAGGVVVDLLTCLLPLMDRRARGIGSLLTVLLDESIRLGRVTSDPALRAWLSEMTGGSAAARAARALLGGALPAGVLPCDASHSDRGR